MLHFAWCQTLDKMDEDNQDFFAYICVAAGSRRSLQVSSFVGCKRGRIRSAALGST